jgi:hypothetical protein
LKVQKRQFQVSAGAIASANVTLKIGQSSVTVEVSAGEVPLIHVDDAQISSTFTMEQVENLPNPGNDLTFVAQTAPGSVMNTQGGYGNFSSFGLPGTANTFTVNGGYYNDPFLNVNNSGATNLTLGNNDVASVTVTSNAYNASFGGLGGAQVSEISRSGGNKFHGNVAYWWNGRAMNANDYFDKQAGNPRSFDNVNQWAAGIGGPIIKDKTFFFFNYEGLRVVLPTRQTVYAPDASYQQQTLANLTANGSPLKSRAIKTSSACTPATRTMQAQLLTLRPLTQAPVATVWLCLTAKPATTRTSRNSTVASIRPSATRIICSAT